MAFFPNMAERLVGTAVDLVSRGLEADGLVMRGYRRALRVREHLEEIQTATLHFFLFPAREDLRCLGRELVELRRTVGALQDLLDRLETELGNGEDRR